MKEKYAAPALERGVLVLEILAREGEMTLEQLVNTTGFPKASLVRFTETLMRMGCLVRDKGDKKYRTLVKLVPIEDSRAYFHQKLHLLMRRLANDTSSTVEWYLPEGCHVTIRERSEPEDAHVFVRARVGFSRGASGELDAVARMAAASGIEASGNVDYWHWLKGKVTPIDLELAASLIETAARNNCTNDVEYNVNGVRRYAAPVRDGAGALKGILAIAESFTPCADETSEQKLTTVCRAAGELELILKEVAEA